MTSRAFETINAQAKLHAWAIKWTRIHKIAPIVQCNVTMSIYNIEQALEKLEYKELKFLEAKNREMRRDISIKLVDLEIIKALKEARRYRK